jgi:uncharacterized membrane protein
MLILLIGITLFLGIHTLTTLRQTRAALIAQFGFGPYKGLYSLLSAAGFVLIAWGFHLYRQEGWVQIWTPPQGLHHLTLALMWFAFVAFAASGPQPGRIRGWLRHPMLVGLKIWALAHLLANGDLGGMVLFTSFLAWAVYDRIQVKRRGDMGAPRIDRFTRADALAIVLGSVAYGAMIFAHPVLIGVPVFGN